MASLLTELDERDPLLARVGWLHISLFILALILSLVDERVVTGINVWIKPMKFMASIAIYLWTIAWFLHYLPGPTWILRLVSWGSSGSMILETLCLWVQAARGTQSHFNNATAFDSAIFGAMGILIMINSLLIFLLFLALLQRSIQLPGVYLWSIRIGVFIFLLGSLEGMVMIANNGHSVGVADGGPGLPFLNWSVEGGDLRIAHMLGLHALQIIPFFGFVVSSRFQSVPESSRFSLLIGFSLVYLVLMVLAFWQAMAGQALIVL
jgi:hypothetical protein